MLRRDRNSRAYRQGADSTLFDDLFLTCIMPYMKKHPDDYKNYLMTHGYYGIIDEDAEESNNKMYELQEEEYKNIREAGYSRVFKNKALNDIGVFFFIKPADTFDNNKAATVIMNYIQNLANLKVILEAIYNKYIDTMQEIIDDSSELIDYLYISCIFIVAENIEKGYYKFIVWMAAGENIMPFEGYTLFKIEAESSNSGESTDTLNITIYHT